MKVLYLTNALTHYYNLVLSKLNLDSDIELVCVVPRGNRSALVGEGVSLTQEGASFKVIELDEASRFFSLYYTYKNLADVIKIEKPDVVVVLLPYLPSFLFELSLIRLRKVMNFALILKDHPFRLNRYNEELQNIRLCNKVFVSISKNTNKLIYISGLYKIMRRVQLEVRRRSFLLADAHVNYIEASDILCSYGVNPEQLFVTRNSPDTDAIFAQKARLIRLPKLFPSNPYRVIHVGRLVGWKKVDLLIRAIAKVKKRYPSVELLILGTGPEEEPLKKLANKLNLSESVNFLGAIYDQRLGQCLMESSLYVLAGMGGLSINDAMAYGLPVLCSTCDGTEKFLVREKVNGRFFKEDDTRDLALKICWFFNDLKNTKKMGMESEKIIKNEINIHTVIDVYKKAFEYAFDKIRNFPNMR